MKIEFLITIIMLLIIGACRKITNPRKKLDMSKGHTKKMMFSTIILRAQTYRKFYITPPNYSICQLKMHILM